MRSGAGSTSVVRVAVMLCVAALACSTGPSPDDEAPTDVPAPGPTATAAPGQVAEEPTPTPTAAPTPSPSPSPLPRALELVGSIDFKGGGFNGDVWGHKGFAYVGAWGAIADDTACPATGVKVVDVRDPSRPRRVGTLQNPDGTSSDDVAVISAQTDAFQGDLAVVGIQACYYDRDPFRGLQLFDVTNPHRPRELGRWESPDGTTGCHEVDLVQHPQGRILASCANVAAVRYGADEAVIVDATDPAAPTTLAGWTDPDVEVSDGVGCLDFSVVHNVRFTEGGREAWVSYWDAGTTRLDLRNPARPEPIETLERDARDEDKDNHSIAYSDGILVINHEDFSPATPEANFEGCGSELEGWGGITVFDVSTPGAAQRLSSFATDGARRSRMKVPRVNTVHNAEFVGTDDVFVSWYSEGVRWLDLSNPRRPREVARFIPPARKDPHGFFPTVPLVWGVSPMPGTDLILASDINGGLYVLRAVGLTP